MLRFANEAEMMNFLGKLDPDYEQYTSALWPQGIRTPRQLADFSEQRYLECGVLKRHIHHIKARAGATGEQSSYNPFMTAQLLYSNWR